METFCFNCPQCKQQLEADEEMRGLVVLCPHCEKGIVVPKKKTGSALLKKPQELAPVGGQSRKAHGADASNPNFASIQRRIEEQETESRKEDELLREKKAKEQKKREEEWERLRKERKAAEAAAEKAQDEQRQKFRSLVKSLSGMQVDLWRNLAKESRPGNFEGTLHAVIPDIHSGETIYEINSHSNGSFDACVLSRSGEQKKVER